MPWATLPLHWHTTGPHCTRLQGQTVCFQKLWFNAAHNLKDQCRRDRNISILWCQLRLLASVVIKSDTTVWHWTLEKCSLCEGPFMYLLIYLILLQVLWKDSSQGKFTCEERSFKLSHLCRVQLSAALFTHAQSLNSSVILLRHQLDEQETLNVAVYFN